MELKIDGMEINSDNPIELATFAKAYVTISKPKKDVKVDVELLKVNGKPRGRPKGKKNSPQLKEQINKIVDILKNGDNDKGYSATKLSELIYGYKPSSYQVQKIRIRLSKDSRVISKGTRYKKFFIKDEEIVAKGEDFNPLPVPSPGFSL